MLHIYSSAFSGLVKVFVAGLETSIPQHVWLSKYKLHMLFSYDALQSKNERIPGKCMKELMT